MAQKKDQPKGVKCLSFQQPYATMIATGIKTVECRSRKIKTPVKDLVVCASKTAKTFPKLEGLVYGYAIGLVDVVDCVPFEKKHLKPAMMSQMPDEGSHAWILENPRLIVPQPVKASASFFYTDFTPEVIDTCFDMYEKYMLPLAYDSGTPEFTAVMMDCLFNDPAGFWAILDL
jgi:hypothetical protein